MKVGSIATLGIVIAAYNAEEYLARAVDSVIAQTDSDWQLVIIDDGSIDSTLAIAKNYELSDGRISAITQSNTGSWGARNAGMALLKTPWIAFHDSDDVLHSDYIEKMKTFVNEYLGYDIYSPNLIMVKPNITPKRHFEFEEAREVTLAEMLDCWRMNFNAAWVRNIVIRETGGNRNYYNEDAEYIYRLLGFGYRAIQTPDALWDYYLDREDNKSNQWTNQLNGYISIFSDFLEEGFLRESDVTLVRNALAMRKLQLEEWEQYQRDLPMIEHQNRQAELIEFQSQKFSNLISRHFGENNVTSILELLHRVTWLVRPFRKLYSFIATRKTI